MLLVNCGCGDKWHRDWINIDFNSTSRYVKVNRQGKVYKPKCLYIEGYN